MTPERDGLVPVVDFDCPYGQRSGSRSTQSDCRVGDTPSDALEIGCTGDRVH